MPLRQIQRHGFYIHLDYVSVILNVLVPDMQLLAAIPPRYRPKALCQSYIAYRSMRETFRLHDHGRKTAYRFGHSMHREFQPLAADSVFLAYVGAYQLQLYTAYIC